LCRAAEAPGSARGLAQLVDFIELGQRHCGRNELGDALAAADGEGLAAMVDEQDLQFAAIIAVDRAGGVGNADAMLEGRPERGRTWISKPSGIATL
jgi:hypothetical protein